MSRSIIQNKKECYFCGDTENLEEHHIFNSANRKLSEKYGLKVYLCHWCHNEPPLGVHFNQSRNLHLKEVAELKFIEYYKSSTEEFRNIFGKNYIEVNE